MTSLSFWKRTVSKESVFQKRSCRLSNFQLFLIPKVLTASQMFVRMEKSGAKNKGKVSDSCLTLSQQNSMLLSMPPEKTEWRTNITQSMSRTEWMLSLATKSSGAFIVITSRMRYRSITSANSCLVRLSIYGAYAFLSSLNVTKSSVVWSFSTLKKVFIKSFDTLESAFNSCSLIFSRKNGEQVSSRLVTLPTRLISLKPRPLQKRRKFLLTRFRYRLSNALRIVGINCYCAYLSLSKRSM